MTKARLLDDDEDLEFGPTIAVNEEYAKRFEYNKRREELHRLQEKHPELAARLGRKAAAEAVRTARQAAGADAADVGDEEDEDGESSSEDDDDDEPLEDDDTDKVLEALVRIKRKDPVVYQKDVVLFPEEDSGPAGGQGEEAAAAADKKAGKGSSKPVYLRTVLAQQALEGAVSSDDEGGSDGEGIPKQPVSHSYAAEQQELKKAFLQAAEQALDQGEGQDVAARGLLKKRKQRAAADGDGEAAGAAGGPAKEQQVNELLDEYFGRDAELTGADAFLKSYLANKAWKEPADRPSTGDARGSRKRLRGLGDDDSSGSDEEHAADGGGDKDAGRAVDEVEDDDDDDDEQFLEEVDRFEAAYNFRFEEPGSHRIQSFPRVIAGSVRRPDERRKRQRQSKAERKAAEQEAREAELRRLKNLKKEEINAMLARIQEEAGILPAQPAKAAAAAATSAGSVAKAGGSKASAKFAGLLDELLEGDFDPEEYDRRMAEAFDDDYYQEAEEAHELFGDGEEELADEADVEAITDPEATSAAGSFAALRQKLKQQQHSEGSGDEEEQQGGSSDADEDNGEQSGEEGGGKGSKAERASKHAQQRSQLQRLLEDYYKLDYEDNIGGLPCRFKYREVPAESFGLTDEEVLGLSDKQLNQIAGLRLLAPYREDAKRLRPNYKALQSIKGEAAAAAALRRQKKERGKWKEKQKKQQAKQQRQREQQGDGLQQQQQQLEKHGGNGKHQHQHQHQQVHKKHSFGQHRQCNQQHQQRHKQQQQKPLNEMTAEEKQAARLASYAKLTLKPSKQAQQQTQGLAAAAGGAGAGKGSKKRRPEQQQGEGGGEKQQRKKQKGPAAQPGRLAAAGVQLETPLSKAQKKNLLRALKRKEKQQGQAQEQEAAV